VGAHISPVQFKDRSFPDRIEHVIEGCGVEGRFIVLEITENTIMENVEFAKRSLDRLKEMGVRVAVDDFGTGYSSLAYLKILPVDYLKIDVSFVRDIDRDPDDRAIVNAIIQLARNLGLKTIAEGIESDEQLEILRVPDPCPRKSSLSSLSYNLLTWNATTRGSWRGSGRVSGKGKEFLKRRSLAGIREMR